MHLVLASASPRRAELLRAAGFDFEIQPVAIDESPQGGELPRDYVVRLAREKAEAVARRRPDALVIGADTAVVIDSAILIKPEDDEDAVRMLTLLSGRTHEVLTGVSVCRNDSCRATVDVTRVRFRDLREAEIHAYVATGEPRDKAGAYAIQGGAASFVDHIKGSLSNVIGLPIEALRDLLSGLE